MSDGEQVTALVAGQFAVFIVNLAITTLYSSYAARLGPDWTVTAHNMWSGMPACMAAWHSDNTSTLYHLGGCMRYDDAPVTDGGDYAENELRSAAISGSADRQ